MKYLSENGKELRKRKVILTYVLKRYNHMFEKFQWENHPTTTRNAEYFDKAFDYVKLICKESSAGYDLIEMGRPKYRTFWLGKW